MNHDPEKTSPKSAEPFVPREADIMDLVRKGILQPFGPEGYHPTRDIDAHFRETHPSFGYDFFDSLPGGDR